MRTSQVGASGALAEPDEVAAAIERWVTDRIITAEQATRMRADLPEPLPEPQAVPPGGSLVPASVPRTSRACLVTEALGYLGGVIILVALGLVVGNVWEELTVGVRLAIVGAAALLLLVAGALIPARLGATGTRLRSVLWFASSASLAALLGIGAWEWIDWADEGVVTFAACGAALLGSVVVGASSSASAHRGLCRAAGGRVNRSVHAAPRRHAARARSLGLQRRLAGALLLGIGAVGTLMVLPPIMGEYFPGALAPALVLLGLGVLLVVAAVLTTRRRGDAGPGAEARWATGTPRSGLLVAVAVVVATSAVVLVAGVR